MVKQIVFGSFDHPFQDGYKSSIIQILFPLPVQGGYLNHHLWYFLYARTMTKSWCSVGMFFDRCTNCQFINWYPDVTIWILVQCTVFLGGLSLHLNHLIGSRVTNYDWPFRTLPLGLFWSNLDTMDLETYPRSYSDHFWHMSLFDDCRAVWVFLRKWVVSENQSFLDEGAIITHLISLVLGGQVPRPSHGPIWLTGQNT